MLPYQYDLMNVSFAKIALSVEQKVKIDALLNAQLLLESRTKYEVVNKYAAYQVGKFIPMCLTFTTVHVKNAIQKVWTWAKNCQDALYGLSMTTDVETSSYKNSWF